VLFTKKGWWALLPLWIGYVRKGVEGVALSDSQAVATTVKRVLCDEQGGAPSAKSN